MRCLLVAIGSMGDNLPFIWLGQALRRRGHDAVLLASGYFEKMARDAGLGFVSLSTAERYMEFVVKQRTWTGLEALDAMAREVLDLAELELSEIASRYVPGETVVAGQGYAFGARFAQEKLGVPLATIHLQPMWMRSIYHAPGGLGKTPLFLLRLVETLTDWIIDGRVGKPLNAIRAKHSLPPVKKVMKTWWNSPQRVIGLFPDWYVGPEPDWPAETKLVGFPLPPPSEHFDMSDVERFIGNGPAPIVFAQSSITSDTEYFKICVEAAERLGRKAILLSPHADIIPPNLPATVRHFTFVPLDKLLPRCAAHVHHGGIGTIAQTLAAGIPQLTVPMVYDQTDNSQRLTPLGASAYLPRKKYSVASATKAIGDLLESRAVAAKCQDYARRMGATRPLEAACDLLEELATRRTTLAAAGART